MSSSSFVPQHRSHVSVLLSSLLAVEKEHVRRWLRDEMDRLIDPILDSLFQRLTNKLMNTDLNRYQSEDHEDGGYRAPVVNQFDRIEIPNTEVKQPAYLICQASVLTSAISYFKPEPDSIDNESEIDPEKLVEVKREIKEEIEIKEENEMALNDINILQSNQEVANDMSHQVDYILQHSQQSHQVNATDNQQDCDEPEPVSSHLIYETMQYENLSKQVNEDDETNNNGGIVEIGEVNEDGDDTEIDTDNDEQESSRSGMNAQIEKMSPPKLSQVFRQSPRLLKRKQHEVQQQAQNEVNILKEDAQEFTSRSVKRPRPSNPNTSSSTDNKQVITVNLRCAHLGCEKKSFSKAKFSEHLLEEHSILPFRCAVKDCEESFDNNRFLGHHLAQSHHHITQWDCDKCDHHFTSYQQLSSHTIQHHQLGLFYCSFPACDFTGEYKRKVYDHYAYQHKETNKCRYCNYQTPNPSKLKQHERTHLGIKPYTCKWSNCTFASAKKSDTIRHIRGQHLARCQSPGPNGNPNDYLEVVHEL